MKTHSVYKDICDDCATKVARTVFSLQEADGFVLPESCAILRYLAQQHKVASHWYPGGLLPKPSSRHTAASELLPLSACHQPTLLEVAWHRWLNCGACG